MSLLLNVKATETAGSPGNFSDSDLKYHSLLEGYTSRKLLTCSYSAKGNNFILKTKGTLDLKGAHYTHPLPKTSYQLKLVTNVEGRNIETVFDNKGHIRLWSNLATFNLRIPANLNGKIKTDSKFQNMSYALGLDWSYTSTDAAMQLHLKNDGHPFLGQKIVYHGENYRVGFIHKMSLATFLWSRLHLFGVYKRGNYNLYFEHVRKGDGVSRMESQGKTNLAATLESSSVQYVLKTTYRHDKPKEPLRFTFGTVAKLDDSNRIRLKANNKTRVAATWKHALNDNINLLVGTQFKLNDPMSFDTGKVVPIPISFSLKMSQS